MPEAFEHLEEAPPANHMQELFVAVLCQTYGKDGVPPIIQPTHRWNVGANVVRESGCSLEVAISRNLGERKQRSSSRNTDIPCARMRIYENVLNTGKWPRWQA